MTKKSCSKLLSVILTIAICATTVLGCLMTVSAEDSSLYEFSRSEFVGDTFKQATLDVTFTAPSNMPNGFVVGIFNFEEIDADAEDYLIFNSITSKTEGIDAIVEGNCVIFESQNGENAFDSATLQFTFDFSNGRATSEKEYKVKITDTELAFNDVEYIIQTAEGPIGKVYACEHKIAAVGQPFKVDAVNGYATYENSVCSKCGQEFGHQLVPSGKTIYWDDTKATDFAGGTGAIDDPYIIETASQLAFLVTRKADITRGKYFKIADGISAIVLQSEAAANEIMALDSAAATKAYFEKNEATAYRWNTNWNAHGENLTNFAGHFDGNGATIYGMYSLSGGNAALFLNVDGGATIKNIALKNSYLSGSHNAYHVAGIAAVGYYGSDKVAGTIWINGCTVANCYMKNAATHPARSGVIAGNFGNNGVIVIENCLVYGNDATYGNSVKMPLVGSAVSNGSVTTSSPKPQELTDYVTYNNAMCNTVRNSIVLGCDVMNTKTWSEPTDTLFAPRCYANVYTDGAAGTVKVCTTNQTYTDAQIKKINASDALGVAAKTNLANLGWAEDGTGVWCAGTQGNYPCVEAFQNKGASNVSNHEFVLYGSNIVYNNDGSFNFNIHFVPPQQDFNGELYVGNIDGSKFYRLTAVESSYRDELGDNAMMFTIPNLSAQYIDTIWLPTLVLDNGVTIEWGRSYKITIADNARAVVAGDYPQDDQHVSASLLQYAQASKAALAIATNDYQAGTVDLLRFGDYLLGLGSTDVYMDTKLADKGETGADWNNAIIIDSAEELVYLCKKAGDETKDKYYKVADGVAGFNLSMHGQLNYNGSYEENFDKIKLGANHSASGYFQGHFDGNGATVYGAKVDGANQAGLFSLTKGNVTVKNINVKLSYLVANCQAGGIIGYHTNNGAANTLVIENCSVTESHIENKNSGWGYAAGAIIGYVGNSDVTYTINNCFVHLKQEHLVANDAVVRGGLTGFSYTNKGSMTNCIVIGVTPYATTKAANTSANGLNWFEQSAHSARFTNIYTDMPSGSVSVGAGKTYDYTGKIYQLTTNQLTGAGVKDNMPLLDWETTWATTTGYPTFVHKDYKAPLGRTIYWDTTSDSILADNGETGEKSNPIIIDSGAELYYLVNAGEAATRGKYFKVADGIKHIILQPKNKSAGIVDLDSAAEVKSHFAGGGFNQWPASSSNPFCGNFDGNGATVYGLYAVQYYNTALFPMVDCGATIQNITLKNSYITRSSGEWNLGGIVASNAAGTAGTIWLDRCTVANCYMNNPSATNSRSGILAGNINDDALVIDNCLVYGNDATYGSSVKMSFVGRGGADAVLASATKPQELTNYVQHGNYVCNTVRNSIVLGCDVMNTKDYVSDTRYASRCYANVYTDGVTGELTISDNITTTVVKYTDAQIKKINAADAQGVDAKANLVNLGWAEDGTGVWHVGPKGYYPAFKTSLEVLYDEVIIDTADRKGNDVEYAANGSMAFGVYQTALSLKANPYMSFAFAFLGDYKTNRDKLQVRFTYTVNGTEYTVDSIPTLPAPVDANGDGRIDDIVNLNGWTNTYSAGRYHTYKAEGIPVEALANGIKVEVQYDGGAWKDFGTFSAEGLALQFEDANKAKPGDYYVTRIEATKALLFYAKMLHARYGSVQ